jgi:hypothetical protein
MKKRHTPEQIVGKLCQAERNLGTQYRVQMAARVR